jgi:hypothetical protein
VQNLDVAIRSCGFYQSLQPFKMHVSPLHDSQKPPFLVPDRFIIKHVSISITWLITYGERGKVKSTMGAKILKGQVRKMGKFI